MPWGFLNEAEVPVPSVEEAVPASLVVSPAIVVTVGGEELRVSFRTLFPFPSTSNIKSPAGERAMFCGPLNSAFVPVPSVRPLVLPSLPPPANMAMVLRFRFTVLITLSPQSQI